MKRLANNIRATVAKQKKGGFPSFFFCCCLHRPRLGLKRIEDDACKECCFFGIIRVLHHCVNIDEFPYLVAQPPELPSVLQRVLENIKPTGLKIVILFVADSAPAEISWAMT